MDRRTLATVAICFLIFLGWQKLYIEPRMPKGRTVETTATVTPSASVQTTAPIQNVPQGVIAAPTKGTEVAAGPVISKPLTLSLGGADVGSGSQFFTGWRLKGYHQGVGQDSPSIDLKAVTNQEGEGQIAFDLPEFSYLADVRGNLVSTPSGVAWVYEDANVKLVREMSASGAQPYVDMKITAEFKNKRPNNAFVFLTAQSGSNDPEAQDRQLVYWSNKSVERVALKENIEQRDVVNPVKWIGTANRYFLMTLISQNGTEPRALIQPTGTHAGRISMVYPLKGNNITIPLRSYFGPKDLDILRSVDPTLDTTVDFGWFTIFAYPLLKLMKWFFTLFHNYGVSIVLLTLLVKLITYPLTYKSMKSMKEMARLQPQLQKIREKHKDDKEALNREMLSLMKTHGYNPMAGCLPILIQMPVFFALYRVLYGSIELYHAPFMLWIHDLSARDPFYVTPILLTVTMYIQQKMTPNTATDPAQAKMMQFMPVIFGAFMLTLPSGLTVYMLVNAVASIVQQFFLNRKLDMGHGRATALAAK